MNDQAYFHVYNRAVAGQQLFLREQNYEYLKRQSRLFATEGDIEILAYCLMPTHYHFLLGAADRTQASRFIQRLFNSYTQAFNRQNTRTGTLFESRAKFKRIETDEYLLQVARYIHLNPVEAGLVKYPEAWKHSNYEEFIKDSENFVLSYFSNAKDYSGFLKTNLAKGPHSSD